MYKNFPNHSLLWTPAELAERMGDDALSLIDVRPTHEVMTGIIPSAAHLDMYGLGLTHTKGEVFDEYANLLRSLLAMRGAGHNQTVVVYEEISGIRAARALWFLEYLGHTDVHLLDGGIKAWREAGFEITREMNPPKPHSLKPRFKPEIFIGADELSGLLADENTVLVDTRTPEEHDGTKIRAKRGGTIPGAVHIEWEKCLDASGAFLPAKELNALYASAGVLPDKRIVPF